MGRFRGPLRALTHSQLILTASWALAMSFSLVAGAQSPTIVELPFGPSSVNLNITGLSADGLSVVGGRVVYATSPFSWHPARWNAAGTLTQLPILSARSSDGYRSCSAYGVSDDGAVTVGTSSKYDGTSSLGSFPVRWDASGAVTELSSFEWNSIGRSSALALFVSGDGSRIAGRASRFSHNGGWSLGMDAVVWNPNGSAVAMTNLGGIDSSGIRYSDVSAISWNGEVIAGFWYAYAPNYASLGIRPVKWTPTGSPTPLPALSLSSAGVANGEIKALSKYGEIAFGHSRKYGAGDADLGQFAVWWDATNAIHEIVLPGTNAAALGCSELGDVAFGTYTDANGTARGFRWTLEDGAVDLGALNGAGLCVPKDLSTDGKTIVGISTATDARGGAFVWRDGTMTSLWSLLATEYQFDPVALGWQKFDEALYCSADGTTIVGKGTRTSGDAAYFRITIPGNEPPTIVSDLVADQTYQVPLGSTLAASFDAEDEDGDHLTLEATGLPASAVLTPTAGTVSPAPAEATLSFVPTTADVGTHAATIRFRDEAGVLTSLAFTIEVPENAAPTITTPNPVVVECEGEQNLVTLSTTVADADPGHTLTVTWKVDGQVEQTNAGVASGAVVSFEFDYPHGESVVQAEVTDGYDAAAASSAVTVEDTTDPLIVVAGDLVVPTDPGESFATNVVLPTPEVHDACDEEPILTNDAPAVYPFGETIVTWTAIDEFGNVGTVTQLVTVVDVEAPSILGGADVTVPVDQGQLYATVVLPQPEALDNVDADVTIASDKPATYPIGQTLVTWTATDDAGNSATWSQTVTVGNQAPVANAGGNRSVVSVTSAGTTVQLNGSSSSDSDGHAITFAWSATGVSFDNSASPTPTGTFPIGPTTVALTVTDQAGAQSTTTITVTVQYVPRKVVDTRPLAGTIRYNVDESLRLATELYAGLGYPVNSNWTWTIHYVNWARTFDDNARSITYDGPSDYAAKLAIYKEYRNMQAGCSQLAERHLGMCPKPTYALIYFVNARTQMTLATTNGVLDLQTP